MFDVQTTVKRRIEILGMCIDNSEPLRAVDYGVLYGCEELTIKRDMQEMRAHGIAIHSAKRQGLHLQMPLTTEMLKGLISQYLGLCIAGNPSDKATAVLVKKHGQRALRMVVTLQRCIEQHRVILVDYQKTGDTLEKGRELWPLHIFQSEGQWRVLAMNDGVLKQYLITKILNLRQSERKFKKVPREQIDEMFRHSFRSWVGPDQFRVTIRLSGLWAGRIRPRQMMETESIVEHGDGSVDFAITVNNLSEVASWVVSRGEGVTVLEPEELKDLVIGVARGALANYGLAEDAGGSAPG